MSLKIILTASFAFALSGCSVYMSAKKEGVDFEDLTTCKTKTCLVANGAEPINVKELPPDTEAYKVLRAHGSIARSFMHGVLDVATLGVWEIAGTPMEGAFDKNKYYAIKVTYEPGTETIRQLALAQ